MGMRNTLIAMIIVTIFFAGIVSTSATVSTSHITSDTDLNNMLLDKAFVAEGRIGDRGGVATFEVDVGEDTSAPADTAQFNWQNCTAYPFLLNYTAPNNVSFTVNGSVIVSWNGVNQSAVSDIFIRTRATKNNSHITVDELILDGSPIADQSFANGSGSGLDILWIQEDNLQNGFVLTGNITMCWGDPLPTQSNLAMQIKVGLTEDEETTTTTTTTTTTKTTKTTTTIKKAPVAGEIVKVDKVSLVTDNYVGNLFLFVGAVAFIVAVYFFYKASTIKETVEEEGEGGE
jgi:hypothetical protein